MYYRFMEDFTTKYFLNDYSMPTVVIYSISIFIGFLALVLGVLEIRSARKQPNPTDLRIYVLAMWGAAWIAMHILLLLIYIIPYIQLTYAYNHNEYQIAEGVVEVLFAQPAVGHTSGDKIRINHTTFEINYFRITPAYHTTIAYHGLLIAGAYVRVYHIHGLIVRIDKKEPQPAIPLTKTPGSMPDLRPTSIFQR